MEIVTTVLQFIFDLLLKTSPLWLGGIIFYAFMKIWLHYNQQKFISGITWTLLEVQIPRDIERTPLAIEMILSNALYQHTNKDLWATWVDGQVPLWFSLEIVSIEGRVHFFIRTPSRLVSLVKSQIYAQYPQSRVQEISEEGDYVYKGPYAITPDGSWYLWGTEFGLSKPEFFPLRTYVDLGLDKPGTKENQKVDTISSTVEALGSLGKGQQVWIQILIRPSVKKYPNKGSWFGSHNWIDEGQEFLQSLQSSYTVKKEDGTIEIKLPDLVKEDVLSVYRKLDKLGFDTGIRVVALGKKGVCSEIDFNSMRRNIRLLFRQFAAQTNNSLERRKGTGLSSWQDPYGKKIFKLKTDMLQQYRDREFFYPRLERSTASPWPSFFVPNLQPQSFVLNTEEIATIFHFPGRVSESPSIERVESRSAEPPSNLPIG